MTRYNPITPKAHKKMREYFLRNPAKNWEENWDLYCPPIIVERKSRTAPRKIKHGHTRQGKISAEYRSWVGAKRRTTSPNASDWKNYGGRGIKMCDRWLNSFENFLADMGPRPEGHSLDRINNHGNYEPGNCRWATHTEQMRNRRGSMAELLEASRRYVRAKYGP